MAAYYSVACASLSSKGSLASASLDKSPFLGGGLSANNLKLSVPSLHRGGKQLISERVSAMANTYPDFPDKLPQAADMTFSFPISTRVPLVAPADVVGVPPGGHPSKADSLPLRWNEVFLQVIRDVYRTASPSLPGPPAAARAFGIFNACLFDAWAAYDPKAIGIAWQYDITRAKEEFTIANKSIAISYAAVLAIRTLFPSQSKQADDFLASLKLTIPATSEISPNTIGTLAATFVLQKFASDGSNFPSYADTSSYRPFNVNNTDKILDPDRWTPVSSFIPLGGRANQDGFLLPHWGLNNKIAFALASPSEFRPPPPYTPTNNVPKFNDQINQILDFSKRIGQPGDDSDRLRAVAEYWADGPNNETAPGIHILQAAYISRRDKHSFDTDIKFFTMLGGTLQDCAITAWDAKRFYDNARMITSIRILRGNQMIDAWGGPGKNLVRIPASKWIPYLPTPPFPDHISGHSTFAGGAAKVFSDFTGSDDYGESFTFKAGTSQIEPGYPLKDVVLKWSTFTQAREENGISRLYGGIHWDKANLDGQASGANVGQKVVARVKQLLAGGH